MWSAAEATLFFIVPDVIISWVAIRKGLRAGVIAAVLAAVGAMIGGAAAYVWGAVEPARSRMIVAGLPAISEDMMTKAEVDMSHDWLAAALKGPLTSTPYKVYAVLAHDAGAGPVGWAAAALPIRLPRFLLVAIAFALIGGLMEGRVSPRHRLGLFTLGWVMFYGWFWLGHPG